MGGVEGIAQYTYFVGYFAPAEWERPCGMAQRQRSAHSLGERERRRKRR